MIGNLPSHQLPGEATYVYYVQLLSSDAAVLKWSPAASIKQEGLLSMHKDTADAGRVKGQQKGKSPVARIFNDSTPGLRSPLN